MTDRPAVVGLAGGIGSGKSLLASAMESLGCIVVDADAVAHEVLDRPEVRETLVGWWGRDVVGADGAVDRHAIAKIVFADEHERLRLESVIHPLVKEACRGRIGRAEPASGLVILDAPLLFEAGLDAWCDVVIFVDSPESAMRARTAANRGWSADEYHARSQVQMPLDAKRSRSDHVVVNAEDPAALRRQAAGLLDRLKPRTD